MSHFLNKRTSRQWLGRHARLLVLVLIVVHALSPTMGGAAPAPGGPQNLRGITISGLSLDARQAAATVYLPLVRRPEPFFEDSPIWAHTGPPAPHEVALFRQTFALADPLDDAALVLFADTRYAGHLTALRATFLLELLAAALLTGATMAVVGAVRGRGSAVANAGAVAGVLGGAGLTLVGLAHLYLVAFAASGSGDAAGVVTARDDAAGWLPLLFLAAPLAVVLLCVAAVMGRLAPWPLLVVAGVFLVLEFAPTPLGDLPALVAGAVALGWTAAALLRSRAASVVPAEAAVPAGR